MRGMPPGEMADNRDGSRRSAHRHATPTDESFSAQAGDGADAAALRNVVGPCPDRRWAWPPAKGPATDTAKVSGADAATGRARGMAPVGRWCADLQVTRRSRQISDAKRQ